MSDVSILKLIRLKDFFNQKKEKKRDWKILDVDLISILIEKLRDIYFSQTSKNYWLCMIASHTFFSKSFDLRISNSRAQAISKLLTFLMSLATTLEPYRVRECLLFIFT